MSSSVMNILWKKNQMKFTTLQKMSLKIDKRKILRLGATRPLLEMYTIAAEKRGLQVNSPFTQATCVAVCRGKEFRSFFTQ